MVKNKTKVAVIILTLNNKKLLEEEFKQFENMSHKKIDIELVVINNGSTDGTRELLERTRFSDIKLHVITNTVNQGFAIGNNQGIKYAIRNSPDYILMLNDDMVFEKDFFEKLVDFANSNSDYKIVSPKIYFAKGHEFHRDRYKANEKGKVIWYAGGSIDWKNIYTAHDRVDEVDKSEKETARIVDVASGACMLIRTEILKKLKGLDEKLFLYWEDADFTQRARLNGFEAVYYPGAHLWHKVSVAAGGSGSPSNDYFLIRNRYYFAKIHAKSFRTKFAVFRDTVKLIFTGRNWQRLGAIDAIIGKMGRGSWKK